MNHTRPPYRPMPRTDFADQVLWFLDSLRPRGTVAEMAVK